MGMSGASASKWSWADLHETGPEAESAAEEAERQRREVQGSYERGFGDGIDAGATAARNELMIALRATGQVMEEIQASRQAWDARLQERLVVLAAAMAQKVIERTRDQDQSAFVDLARQAVAAFPVEEALRIRLHPADQAVLADGGFLDEVIGMRSVRWIPDDEVVPGGCIVEGPDKIVDGRVDEALVRMVEALTNG